MGLLQKSRKIKTFMVLVTLYLLIFAFNGCIADDLRDKLDVNNGHWVYEDGKRVGCLEGGTECIYGGASSNPR